MADTEALVNQLNECAEKQDFEGAFRLVRENRAELDKKIRATGIRDALKKTTDDRLLLALLRSCFRTAGGKCSEHQSNDRKQHD